VPDTAARASHRRAAALSQTSGASVIVAGMVPEDPEPTPLERTAQMMRIQAEGCRKLGSPLYGDLLLHAADDLLTGGPTAEVLAGHLDDRLASALALRMLGGAHALALSGQAPGLANWYPSVGGLTDPEPGSPRAWSALRATLDGQRDAVRSWLSRPPQTNEVGRAAALLGGLMYVITEARLPVRLVEVGASAGLNLRADRFHIPGDVGRYGEPDSAVALRGAWQGEPPPDSKIELVERTGGDVAPIDPLTADGRLILTAYVWPDQSERIDRLRGALAIAEQVPADLRAEPAGATLARTELVPGTWTVLWHSIFRQYLSQPQREELADGVAALAVTATRSARFAYLYFEQSKVGGCRVTLTTWPGGRRRDLGMAPAHGMPVRWQPER
jgi:hypothetical protein